MRQQAASTLPSARVLNLVITETKDEVLVYDTERHHIHHLNQVSAVIWRLLDGTRSIADVTWAAHHSSNPTSTNRQLKRRC